MDSVIIILVSPLDSVHLSHQEGESNTREHAWQH